jgi:L-fuconolactonase
MVIDAHTHVFARWPFAPVPDPDLRSSADSLCHQMTTAGVDRALVIASVAGGNDDNNAFVLSAAACHDRHLVPFIHLPVRELSSQRFQFRQLESLPFSQRIGGLATVVDEPAWLMSQEADTFFREVADQGLPVNLALPATGFASLASCAGRHPGVTYLVNEMGNARVLAHQPLVTYIAHVLAIKPCPNVVLKISGFPRLAEHPWDFPFQPWLWLVRLWRDHLGAERLCWGSEFPGAMCHITYRQSLEIVRTHASFLTVAERRLILGENVARILRTPFVSIVL